MAVYIGPCSYGTPEPESNDRFITADSNDEPSKSVDGDLDMEQHRITNVREPRQEESSDATTVGYVGRLTDYIYSKKVDWTGGIMVGNLSMGSHKITNVADPEDNEDAVNKQYLDQVINQTRPYDLGRYLVFPHTDDTKSYFTVGSKRNIDLDNDRLFQLFNGDVDSRNIAHNELHRSLLPIQGKDNVMMLLDNLNQPFTIRPQFSQPWTFLFSAKPYSPPVRLNDITMHFAERAPGVYDNIVISWSPNSFTYTISGQSPVEIEIDTSVLNHFAFEYSSKKLVVWVNGFSRKTHTGLTLNTYEYVRFGNMFVGVISLYDRKLGKPEVIEHYVNYHVEPFRNDEVYS